MQVCTNVKSWFGLAQPAADTEKPDTKVAPEVVKEALDKTTEEPTSLCSKAWQVFTTPFVAVKDLVLLVASKVQQFANYLWSFVSSPEETEAPADTVATDATTTTTTVADAEEVDEIVEIEEEVEAEETAKPLPGKLDLSGTEEVAKVVAEKAERRKEFLADYRTKVEERFKIQFPDQDIKSEASIKQIAGVLDSLFDRFMKGERILPKAIEHCFDKPLR